MTPVLPTNPICFEISRPYKDPRFPKASLIYHIVGRPAEEAIAQVARMQDSGRVMSAFTDFFDKSGVNRVIVVADANSLFAHVFCSAIGFLKSAITAQTTHEWEESLSSYLKLSSKNHLIINFPPELVSMTTPYPDDGIRSRQ